MKLVGEFLDGSPADVVDQLPTQLRVGYELVRLDRPAELVEFQSFLREHDWRLPFDGVASRSAPTWARRPGRSRTD